MEVVAAKEEAATAGAKHGLEVAAAVDAKRGASLQRASSGGGASDERQSEADEARSPRSSRSPRSPQTNDELQSSSLRSPRSSHDFDAVSETDDEDLRADPLPQRVPAIVKRTAAWGVTPGIVTPRGPAVARSPSASPDKSDFAASAKAVRGGCAPCARGCNPMW